jgi:hypothetical protein
VPFILPIASASAANVHNIGWGNYLMNELKFDCAAGTLSPAKNESKLVEKINI